LLGFTIVVVAITVLIFGLVPAWRATRVSAQSAMKAQGRSVVEGHTRWSLGKALVVAQVALSLVLVISAGLFLSTFRNLARVNPGFTADGVLLADVDLRRAGIAEDGISLTQNTILERVRAIPGVVSAARSGIVPVGGSSWNEEIVVDGYVAKSETDAVTWFTDVSDGYFETMKTRLLAGRDFNRSDAAGAPRVAIVNDAWGRKFFGAATPIGRQFRLKEGDRLSDPITIVGVVENTKYQSLRESVQEVGYFAREQSAPKGAESTFLLRVKGDPLSVIPLVTRTLDGVHSGISVEFTTLSRQLASSLQRERLLAILSALFGGLALLLAILGLYGVMSYAVARRRGEIGVRIALGAARDRVVRMVLGEVAAVVVIGVIIGGAASLASGKLVTAFLYNVRPVDYSVYLIAIAILSTVALGAGLVPAWRAARVDPMEALREQ
jgi:predicted permease